MGRFGGVEDATPSEGGVWIIPGVYDVKVLKCKAGTTRKKLEFFAAEVEILKSDNPERRVGSTMTWFVGLKPDTPALGDVRGFIATAENVPLSEVSEEICEYVVSDANPLEGKLLHVVAVNITTKAQEPFTKCKWTPMGEAVKAA